MKTFGSTPNTNTKVKSVLNRGAKYAVRVTKIYYTSLSIAMDRSCKNSFVLSASWPATTLAGLTFTSSPVVNAIRGTE